jgi:molybdenum cofactor cytidylyltransferase
MNTRYAAVVLAGGLSTRMEQFKPLLPLGDTTVIDHVIDKFLRSGIDVILVTGYRHQEIETAVKHKKITVIYNPDYKHGMFTSVQTGVSRVGQEYHAFFIAPADIPLVRQSTIRRLTDAAEENPEKVIYPAFGGKRGHPPLIPWKLASDILVWRRDSNLKAFLEAQETSALEVPVADSLILHDMDTEEEYLRLIERFRRYEIPADEECREILTTICKVDPDRIRHSEKVAEAAVEICRAFTWRGFALDLALIYTSALLHDIAKGQRKHDIAGGKILREMGFGEVGDIVGVHSDLAGGNTNLSLEAKIVYIADKLIEDERQVTLEERYRTSRHRYGVTPEIEAAINERLKVAKSVKMELEKLIGHRLETVLSGYL